MTHANPALWHSIHTPPAAGPPLGYYGVSGQEIEAKVARMQLLSHIGPPH
jgi:hypothetical protein